MIGLAAGEQLFGHFAMPGGAAERVDAAAAQIELEPLQTVENGGNSRFGRPLAIGVLDPQQHLAAALLGVEPGEQRGAGASDMEKAGGRGGEAGDDGISHYRGGPYA